MYKVKMHKINKMLPLRFTVISIYSGIKHHNFVEGMQRCVLKKVPMVFSGGSVVKTPHLQFEGRRFNPWSEN